MAVSAFPTPPPSIRNDPASLRWFVDLVNRVIAEGAGATTALQGLVKQGTAVSDAAASTVSVDSADATDLPTVITLANEIKGDVNQLVSDHNDLKDQLNALLTSLRTAGVLDT